MIQRKVDKLNGNLEIGRRYKIRYIAGKNNKNGTNRFEGTLIEKLDKFYVFMSILGFRECYLKADFIIGEYAIEEA